MSGPAQSNREQVSLQEIDLFVFPETIISVIPPILMQTRRDVLPPSHPSCDTIVQVSRDATDTDTRALPSVCQQDHVWH